MINNTDITRVEEMARPSNTDDVWNEIFDSLILSSEPPIEYIKNVIITTKTGVRLKVSAFDFAQILERERFISPEDSDILSCRLAINFDKVRKDVNAWARETMRTFDKSVDLKTTVIASKPKTKTKAVRAAKKPVNKTAAKTTKKAATKTTTKKTAVRKPRGSSKKI